MRAVVGAERVDLGEAAKMLRILFAGLMASTLLFAQRVSSDRTSGLIPGSFAGSRLERLTARLSLNKDQRKGIKAAMDAAQKEATPIHEQILKGRLAIGEAVAAHKGQAEIDAAIHSQAELETQMASVELHAFAKAVVLLEESQKGSGGVQVLFETVRGAFDAKNWDEVQP